MLHLRPHHILDIVRNIGNGREIKPHEYGHLVHEITSELLTAINQECVLVIENDDICGPCIHLDAYKKCNDVLHQLDQPISKQKYNDELDTKILLFLNIQPNTIIKVSDYLHDIKEYLDEIVEICTHPKEDKDLRKYGLIKGLKILKISKSK